jgi:hypothetical protein
MINLLVGLLAFAILGAQQFGLWKLAVWLYKHEKVSAQLEGYTSPRLELWMALNVGIAILIILVGVIYLIGGLIIFLLPKG